MKTHLENTNKFMDLLNFNYRFKGINSEFASLKDFENIKIQTDTFKDMKDISELITQITGISTKAKTTDDKEILDARAPFSSRNQYFVNITKDKKRLIILNKN